MRVGNESRIIVTARDRVVLAELARVRLATGVQLASLAGFASKTRVNARLLQLTRAGLIRRSFFGTIQGGRAALYRLPGGIDRAANRAGHVEHQLAITDVYVSLRRTDALGGACLTRFELGSTALMAQATRIIPDAYLEISAVSGTRAFFLEVDRGTEALPVWRSKAQAYVAFARSGTFEEHFAHAHFGVLVVARSARRTDGIRSAVGRVTGKLFYLADLKSVTSEGPLAPIWQRPDGARDVSLM